MKKLRLLFLLLLFLFMTISTYAADIGLAWDKPLKNTDGSTLTNLMGYKVYYGTYSRKYFSSNDVGNVTNTIIRNVPSTARYFAVTSYNTLRLESDYTEELLWFSYGEYYLNEKYLTSECENWILDYPMTNKIVSGVNYIYSKSNNLGKASFMFKDEGKTPTNSPFVFWMRTQKRGFLNFWITHDAHPLDYDKRAYAPIGGFSNWTWERLKQINTTNPITFFAKTNIFYVFTFSTSTSNVPLDKLIITKDMKYDPNAKPVPLPPSNLHTK